MDKSLMILKLKMKDKHKISILIYNIDINKMVVPNIISIHKNDFKYFISYEDAKKLVLYTYSFQT